MSCIKINLQAVTKPLIAMSRRQISNSSPLKADDKGRIFEVTIRDLKVNDDGETICEELEAEVESENKCETTGDLQHVIGLSEAVLKYSNGEKVGPGASKRSAYKNPEYFSFHRMSYYNAVLELAKYRLPPISNKEVY